MFQVSMMSHYATVHCGTSIKQMEMIRKLVKLALNVTLFMCTYIPYPYVYSIINFSALQFNERKDFSHLEGF